MAKRNISMPLDARPGVKFTKPPVHGLNKRGRQPSMVSFDAFNAAVAGAILSWRPGKTALDLEDEE